MSLNILVIIVPAAVFLAIYADNHGWSDVHTKFEKLFKEDEA